MKPEEFSKKYGIYFAVIFVFLVIIFIWLGFSWVKSDNNPKSVEESLKEDLLKNPINEATLQTNQNLANSQSQASQSSQAAQNSTQTNSSLSDSSDSAINTDNADNGVGETTPESSDTKKFESTVLKVSFDYPKDASVSEGDKLITITNNKISWKIRFYDNKNKKDFQSWYTSHFDIKTVADCTFTDAVIKAGSYESKLVKPSSATVTCDGDGNYAINTDKLRVVKIEAGKETTDNINKILTSFKFTE